MDKDSYFVLREFKKFIFGCHFLLKGISLMLLKHEGGYILLFSVYSCSLSYVFNFSFFFFWYHVCNLACGVFSIALSVSWILFFFASVLQIIGQEVFGHHRSDNSKNTLFSNYPCSLKFS